MSGIAKGAWGVNCPQCQVLGDNQLSLTVVAKIVQTLVIINNNIMLYIIGKVI